MFILTRDFGDMISNSDFYILHRIHILDKFDDKGHGALHNLASKNWT